MSKQSFSGRLLRNRQGQGMVEYALLVAGIALVGIIGVSLIGEKTGDLLDLVAVILPGSDTDDNAAIGQGHLIEDVNNGGVLEVDAASIMANQGTSRLGQNMFGPGVNIGNGGLGLIVDPVQQSGGS